MKIEYDQRADAVYLPLQSRMEKVWKSREVEPGVILDLNRKREVIGIEILDVSRRYRPADVFQFAVRHIGFSPRAAVGARG